MQFSDWCAMLRVSIYMVNILLQLLCPSLRGQSVFCSSHSRSYKLPLFLFVLQKWTKGNESSGQACWHVFHVHKNALQNMGLKFKFPKNETNLFMQYLWGDTFIHSAYLQKKPYKKIMPQKIFHVFMCISVYTTKNVPEVNKKMPLLNILDIHSIHCISIRFYVTVTFSTHFPKLFSF